MFPDGTKFYPDIKDGERGFNTDAARGADTFIPFSKGVKILKVLGVHSGTYDFKYTATNKCKLICYLSAFYGDAGQTISVQASINGTHIFNKSMVPPAGGGSGYNYSDIKNLNPGDIFYGRVSVPNFGYASHVSMFIAVID